MWDDDVEVIWREDPGGHLVEVTYCGECGAETVPEDMSLSECSCHMAEDLSQ